MAPPGTPAAVSAALSSAVFEVVSGPDFHKRVLELGMTPLPGTQAEFAKYYGEENARWGEVIRAAKVRLD